VRVRGLEPGKRAALVVNEMQNAIANPAHVDTPLAGQVTARGIIARINTLTAAFRAAGAPVIFCTIAARTPDWTASWSTAPWRPGSSGPASSSPAPPVAPSTTTSWSSRPTW
jgi:nicotinamidase-related amidase